MRPAFFVCIILLLIPIDHIFSQNTGADAAYRSMYNEAENLYNSNTPTEESDEKAIELYQKIISYLSHSNIQHHRQVDCHKKIGDVYLGKGEFRHAISYYNNVIVLNKNLGLKDSLFDYQAKLYLGSAYYQLSIIDSARYFFEHAAFYAYHRTDLPDQSFLYNSLGVIYFESGNFMQAKNYFEQALPNDKDIRSDDPETYVSIYTNIATCLKSLGREKEAIAYYHDLLPVNISTEKIHYQIANTYLNLRQYDSALHYYKAIGTSGQNLLIKKLNDVGRIMTEQGKWAVAERMFDSSVLLNKQYIGTKNKDLAYSYLYKAELAGQQGLLDEGIAWCNYALQVLHFDFKWKNPTDLPADDTKIISPLVFFEVLQKKAQLLNLKYQNANNLRLRESSLNTYMKAIKVATFIKVSFDNDDARLFFKERYKDIYSEAIAVAYSLSETKELNAADNFLRIMESYKGSVLYHNLLQVELKRSNAMPASVFQKEKELKQTLAAYSTRLNNTKNAEDVSVLQERIIGLEVEISRLQRLYEQYPEFEEYKRQADANSITIDTIQDQLDDQTAIIGFLYTNDFIYGCAITNNKFIIRRIEADSLLHQNIQIFLSALYEHDNGKRYDGYSSSAVIYNRLIRPFLPAIADKKRWVILPDGILNNMPFNALQENPAKRHYLAEDKIVSNHYSLLLLLRKNKISSANAQTPVIFAPFMQSSSENVEASFPVLYSSATEVAAFRGISFTGDKATKANFLAAAENASIVHLSTHATADVDGADRSCIYFYPSGTDELGTRLYAPEIYNLDLNNTRLVILSACETARGKNTPGEGLLSLTRGFLYAGSDGVISTFWKTDDKVSAYIMQQLHQYLQQGKTPEEALYFAKNDFIANEKFDLHYKTPNYWANFIFIGNLSTQEQDTKEYYIAAIALAAFVALYALRKIKTRRKIYNNTK